MLDNLPVSPPQTIYDWAALKESWLSQLNTLDYDTLATFYGLSCVEPYLDPDYCRQVEQLLDSRPEPVRARFEFAYYLASTFYETYYGWGMVNIATEPDSYQWRRIPAGEPGWVGEIPPALIERSKQWLMAGIRAYRQDRELMQNIHWLKYRLGMSDTFLSRADIKVLEAELGYDIKLAKDEVALDLARKMIEAFNAAGGPRTGDETPPADENNQP